MFPYGGAEITEFERQRFRDIDTRRHDVSRSVSKAILTEGAWIRQARSRVEDTDRLIARVVVDKHLLRSDDSGAPELARREPRELDVRNHARFELQIDE